MGPWWAIDARSLALFRGGLGVAVLLDLIDRAGDLDVYTDQGPLPAAKFLEVLGPAPSVLLACGSQWCAAVHMIAIGVAALALVVGLKTRVATIICLLGMLSLQVRQPLVSFGGDPLIMALLVLGAMVPLGARWSIDSGLDRSPLAVRSPATAALIIQPIMLHAGSIPFKLQSAEWVGGDALATVLRGHLHPSIIGSWWVDAFPSVQVACTFAALAIEAAAVFLLVPVRAIRVATLAALMGLQLGMSVLIEAGPFQVFSLVSLLPLLPGPPSPVLVETSRPLRVVGVALVAIILATNIANAAGIARSSSTRPAVTQWLGLDQSWRMFSDPAHLPRGWFYVLGVKPDGQAVDLLLGTSPPTNARPPQPFGTYASFRVRRLWEWHLFGASQPFHADVAAWLCRRAAVEGLALDRVAAWFIDDASGTAVPMTLFDHRCGPPP